MATRKHRPDLITGQLQFSNQPLEDVLKLAEEYKDSEQGRHLKFLCVRNCGEQRFGIAFAYRFDGSIKSYKAFVYNLTDQLKRRFGNNVNWDITSSTWLIE